MHTFCDNFLPLYFLCGTPNGDVQSVGYFRVIITRTKLLSEETKFCTSLCVFQSCCVHPHVPFGRIPWRSFSFASPNWFESLSQREEQGPQSNVSVTFSTNYHTFSSTKKVVRSFTSEKNKFVGNVSETSSAGRICCQGFRLANQISRDSR